MECKKRTRCYVSLVNLLMLPVSFLTSQEIALYFHRREVLYELVKGILMKDYWFLELVQLCFVIIAVELE